MDIEREDSLGNNAGLLCCILMLPVVQGYNMEAKYALPVLKV